MQTLVKEGWEMAEPTGRVVGFWATGDCKAMRTEVWTAWASLARWERMLQGLGRMRV